MGITIDQYEVNEALDGADLSEVYQPSSAGVRREKKATLDVKKEFYIGGILDRIGRPASTLFDWSDSVSYTSIGTHVLVNDRQYVNINNAGNLNKNPLVNPTFWYPVPEFDVLQNIYSRGLVLRGGMSPLNDRSSSQFVQAITFGQYDIGGTRYNGFKVALDGTQVTGSTLLNDTIFKVGQSDEYAYLDRYAPDDGGTRTLLDVGDYVSTPQSSGGDADTIGQLVEDQIEDHTHTVFGNLLAAGGVTQRELAASSGAINVSSGPVTVGSARTGSTTHGKRFTEGASYIIVMVQS